MNEYKGPRRKRRYRSAILGMIFILLGGILAIAGWMERLTDNAEIANAKSLSGVQLERDKYVQGDTDSCYGAFYDTYLRKHGLTTIITKTFCQRIYLVPVGRDKDVLIGINVEDTSFYELNAIVAATQKGEKSALKRPFHFVGKVRTYDSKQEKALSQYKEQAGITAEILPYYVECRDEEMGYDKICIGVVLLLIGTFSVIVNLFSGNHKKMIVPEKGDV